MNTGPKKPRRGVPVKLYPSDATLAYLRAVAQLSGASLRRPAVFEAALGPAEFTFRKVAEAAGVEPARPLRALTGFRPA